MKHLKKTSVKDDFILELPKQRFTEKMTIFFEDIKNKLPCSFNNIFDEIENQIEIYEKFVYLLHLLQLNKIKYEKNTDTLYF